MIRKGQVWTRTMLSQWYGTMFCIVSPTVKFLKYSWHSWTMYQIQSWQVRNYGSFPSRILWYRPFFEFIILLWEISRAFSLFRTCSIDGMRSIKQQFKDSEFRTSTSDRSVILIVSMIWTYLNVTLLILLTKSLIFGRLFWIK